ncbi:MAG: helix-turn-helix transcriptional regulator [Actinobacteria bacterium]|nr:helix-turn-helix transcriptional regulator [Actinomycetota bacterium]
MRAVAHPTRIRILARLRLHGPATATECSRTVGESPSSCSYHLRQLARFGFVEEVEDGADGRERRWRARGFGMRWARTGSPEHLAASETLREVFLDTYLKGLGAWFEREKSEPAEWREAMTFGDSLVAVTATELRQLDERIRELMEPYFARVRDHLPWPEGARLIRIARFGSPAEDL